MSARISCSLWLLSAAAGQGLIPDVDARLLRFLFRGLVVDRGLRSRLGLRLRLGIRGAAREEDEREKVPETVAQVP
jgi:hypothetical protein